MKPTTKKPHKKQVSRHNKASNDLIWGVHPVTELLNNSPEKIIELRFLNKKTTKTKPLLELAEKKQVPFHIADNPYTATPEHATHQGVLAKIKPVQTVNLSQIIAASKNRSKPPLILALDNIQDPHNFGAIIRSASAAGVQGIIFTKDRSAPLSGTVTKVSTGAINHMPLCPVTNMVSSLSELQKNGFWIYGAEGRAEQSVYSADFTGPVCLVIGGENKGIRPLVKKQCDFLLSIPMQSDLDSLNASVAAAVILFEIVRQQAK